MESFKTQFITAALSYGALQFGEFTLKSGRKSPYFFNMGVFYTGKTLSLIGQCYATFIQSKRLSYDVLYGPAYKGIPLVTATSTALWQHFHKEVPYTFNRKEVKDHGEGGILVGAPLEGHVLLIDDVITAGTAVHETIQLVATQPRAKLSGIVIGLDRQERGQHQISAVREVEARYGVPVYALITLTDLLTYLEKQGQHDTLQKLRGYQQTFGVVE